MAGTSVAYLLKMYPRLSETFILNELLELERQGLRLRIFSLKEPEDDIFHEDVARVRAPVTYLPPLALRGAPGHLRAHAQLFRLGPRRYLRALRRVLRSRSRVRLKRFLQAGYIAPFLEREGISHVHAHFASGASSVALELQRIAGVSYSFTAHAKDIFHEGVDSSDLGRKLGAARFVVTISDYNRDYLAQLNGGARLVRVYNGLDLSRFSRNGAARSSPPLVLAVGRLVEKKGLADLVRACALLRGRVPFHCRIVGKGPLRSELLRLVRELELDDVVELTGALAREDVLEQYRSASVVVVPCVVGSDGNKDGLPTVLIEAMALGVPVVATPVTGIPELVDDGRTGLLVPERDPGALAGAIATILTDPGLAARLTSAARTRVERAFDLRVNVSRLRGLLDEAVGP